MASRHISVRTGLLVAALCLASVGCSAAGSQGTADPPTEPDRAAMRADLDRLASDAADFELVRAVVAATSDEILLERYAESEAETTWNVHGVIGSVMSTLVGIAVDEGLVEGPDAPLAELLPQHAEAMSPAVARTTLRQLLTMTGGFPKGMEFTTADDWVRTILENPSARPGGDFTYSQATAHLLAAIVARAGEVSVLDFARSRLFDPLGIDTRPAMQGPAGIGRTPEFVEAGFAWTRDPQGVHAGWNGLKLRPRDLVELGRLVLADGIRDGEQLVSKAWLDDATSRQVPVTGARDGYGYLWWTDELDGEHAAIAHGAGGQLLVVVPARDLVVVTAARGMSAETLLDVVEEAIVAHVPDRPGPLDPLG
jgi:CubicO group peptidase (beta-lactamase class C family)